MDAPHSSVYKWNPYSISLAHRFSQGMVFWSMGLSRKAVGMLGQSLYSPGLDPLHPLLLAEMAVCGVSGSHVWKKE